MWLRKTNFFVQNKSDNNNNDNNNSHLDFILIIFEPLDLTLRCVMLKRVQTLCMKGLRPQLRKL